ncbi:MAG: hypothetical protein R3246_13980 [Acidimicrobiia bacterium]|nr:hypothetical protein [Acidimicrobiia bacterium]
MAQRTCQELAQRGGFAQAVGTARAVLTRVVLVGLAGMTLSAAFAVVLAEEPIRQVGGLAARVAASALSFAVLLRVGAWALDPQGGRSPVAAGGSALLSSGAVVLVWTAAGGLVVAGLAMLTARSRRKPAAT